MEVILFEREFDYDYIVFLKKLGLSNAEIAKVVGCHVLTVGRAAKGTEVNLEFQHSILGLAYKSSKS